MKAMTSAVGMLAGKWSRSSQHFDLAEDETARKSRTRCAGLLDVPRHCFRSR